jgi:hypothetical protein
MPWGLMKTFLFFLLMPSFVFAEDLAVDRVKCVTALFHHEKDRNERPLPLQVSDPREYVFDLKKNGSNSEDLTISAVSIGWAPNSDVWSAGRGIIDKEIVSAKVEQLQKLYIKMTFGSLLRQDPKATPSEKRAKLEYLRACRDIHEIKQPHDQNVSQLANEQIEKLNAELQTQDHRKAADAGGIN